MAVCKARIGLSVLSDAVQVGDRIGAVAAFGGHSASADQPKVHQPSVHVMQREAWERKYGVQCGCADACVAA